MGTRFTGEATRRVSAVSERQPGPNDVARPPEPPQLDELLDRITRLWHHVYPETEGRELPEQVAAELRAAFEGASDEQVATVMAMSDDDMLEQIARDERMVEGESSSEGASVGDSSSSTDEPKPEPEVVEPTLEAIMPQSVAKVVAWVGADLERAAAVLDVERAAESPRKTLIEKLERAAASG